MSEEKRTKEEIKADLAIKEAEINKANAETKKIEIEIKKLETEALKAELEYLDAYKTQHKKTLTMLSLQGFFNFQHQVHIHKVVKLIQLEFLIVRQQTLMSYTMLR